MPSANDITLDDDATSAEPDVADTVPSDEAQTSEHPHESIEAVDSDADIDERPAAWRRINWARVVVLGVLPTLALSLAVGAAYFKWRDTSVREADVASAESVRAAHDSTIALLSYQPDQVDQQLGAAQNLLTGEFKNSYSQLTHDVVIPGAKQKHISAVVSVPAVASVSATPSHAVTVVFVDQTVTVGNDAPVITASTVRVTLDRVDGHWLISSFDPL